MPQIPHRVIYGSENIAHACGLAGRRGQRLYRRPVPLDRHRLPRRGGRLARPRQPAPACSTSPAFPKSQYYFRKSLWTDAPMVYLSTAAPGRRRFRPGASARAVWCYTNCDNVELFHDGKSLGSKPLPAEHVITWPLEFTSGDLKAVGTKGGKQATYELKKAGAAAKLVLQPDVQKLAADGRDVAQIEVNVTDKDGTRRAG